MDSRGQGEGRIFKNYVWHLKSGFLPLGAKTWTRNATCQKEAWWTHGMRPAPPWNPGFSETPPWFLTGLELSAARACYQLINPYSQICVWVPQMQRLFLSHAWIPSSWHHFWQIVGTQKECNGWLETWRNYCPEKKNETKYRYNMTKKVMIDVTFVVWFSFLEFWCERLGHKYMLVVETLKNT